ncbi:hypothetical protein RhiirA1_445811 [Rhizophagus irregularis]|uniref:Uncharacterized protein n=1 Tax=Rhizophagus irregularis TaxID=588596 RepID=A0A2N0R527_9GLOM|nr:hypothetical protein RhiirA1_445811 [Rhizophagus irregularis]
MVFSHVITTVFADPSSDKIVAVICLTPHFSLILSEFSITSFVFHPRAKFCCAVQKNFAMKIPKKHRSPKKPTYARSRQKACFFYFFPHLRIMSHQPLYDQTYTSPYLVSLGSLPIADRKK